MQGSFLCLCMQGRAPQRRRILVMACILHIVSALWKYHNSKGIRTVSKYQKK